MPKTILEMAAEIVSGQSSQRVLSGEEIQGLLNDTYQALKRIERLESQGCTRDEMGIQPDTRSIQQPDQEQAVFSPEIDPQRSIQENTIICLECGGKYKQLTHTHLQREHGLTPGEYRRKYNISSKQPLAAKSVSERRKAQAKDRNVGEQLRLARVAAKRTDQSHKAGTKEGKE
ncbi:MAG: MucR family transcriptional regulator [Syntrophobacteraceae bacterium]